MLTALDTRSINPGRSKFIRKTIDRFAHGLAIFGDFVARGINHSVDNVFWLIRAFFVDNGILEVVTHVRQRVCLR